MEYTTKKNKTFLSDILNYAHGIIFIYAFQYLVGLTRAIN